MDEIIIERLFQTISKNSMMNKIYRINFYYPYI
jgi:hypothetical protein